jgi:hypothetical protein
MLGIGPSCTCKGWFIKLNIFPVLQCLYIFFINNVFHFPPAKLTFVKEGVIYFATKIFNQLPSNISELKENKKMLFKSALGQYLLIHILYSVEEFLLHNSDIK